MSNNQETRPFPDVEAVLATVARLFASEGDLLAVDLLSTAQPRFEWSSHDNWDGGFDMYNLYLEIPLALYSKVGDRRQSLEQRILDKIQSVSQGHTSDHVQAVSIILKMTGGKDWRKKAKKWGGTEGKSDSQETLSPRSISVHPEVFQIPAEAADDNQVAVMMSFAAEFSATYEAIKTACRSLGLTSRRADDIWSNSTFIQDVFDLIYRSRIIIVDFSGRNPNVMYETGVAHTLGRHAIPITRSIADVPSDLQHHRALVYLPNGEGLLSLANGLAVRLSTITGREPAVGNKG
jgi:hypothetical protein